MARRWFFETMYLFRKPPWDTGVSPPELLRFLESHPPGRALDLGCGTGTNLLTLARHGWQAVGVDFARLAVWRARWRLRRAGVPHARVYYGDVTRPLPIQGPFDLVLDIGCYHGLPPETRKGYRDNLMRWLKPGGFYLLYAFSRAPSSPQPGPPGVDATDLEAFTAFLVLLRKEVGEDRGRPAQWLYFQRKAPSPAA